MRRATWITLVAAAVVVSFSIGLAAFGGGSSARGSSSVVDEVRTQLVTRYYRPVPPEVLSLTDVDAMISALGDPYTEFLDPGRYRLLRRETTGMYSGVGMTLLPAARGLLVTRLQPGPARIAGIRPGDTILEVDGVQTAGLSYEEALGRILGRSGSSVQLRVLRGPHTLDVRLVRKQFRIPAVRTRLLAAGGKKVGYLQLSSFTSGAAQAIESAVTRLDGEGAQALVLDLRGNPGGLLDQAVGVTSLFLDRGVVASTSGAHEPQHVYVAQQGRKSRLPLAVLIDGGSASAAEIVAAALHDHHRALLVGQRSFGKALVQSIEPLAAGAALKLTTARYLTPSGADLSQRGVEPDVRAPDDPATPVDEGLAAALRALAG
jgi:carboxyl-terminal processing protease